MKNKTKLVIYLALLGMLHSGIIGFYTGSLVAVLYVSIVIIGGYSWIIIKAFDNRNKK